MIKFKVSDIVKAVRERATEACRTCSDEKELISKIQSILNAAWIACGKDIRIFSDIESNIYKSLDFKVKPITRPKLKQEKTYLEKMIKAARDLGIEPDSILRALELERHDDIMQIARNVTDDPDIFDETF